MGSAGWSHDRCTHVLALISDVHCQTFITLIFSGRSVKQRNNAVYTRTVILFSANWLAVCVLSLRLTVVLSSSDFSWLKATLTDSWHTELKTARLCSVSVHHASPCNSRHEQNSSVTLCTPAGRGPLYVYTGTRYTTSFISASHYRPSKLHPCLVGLSWSLTQIDHLSAVQLRCICCWGCCQWCE